MGVANRNYGVCYSNQPAIADAGNNLRWGVRERVFNAAARRALASSLEALGDNLDLQKQQHREQPRF
jgi:hypothetical protein